MEFFTTKRETQVSHGILNRVETVPNVELRRPISMLNSFVISIRADIVSRVIGSLCGPWPRDRHVRFRKWRPTPYRNFPRIHPQVRFRSW